ncbi:hypothetical protein COUCH_26720 [Couchioplanes caeruleus]|uniref:hypothetical protein n=1 Tax=Couchioplanes caeruleus TaxID=56438 RepID=UPI0020BF963B|nr:hypothetical protein [Couchioplanes caeruleus]UQU62609.1 hypothetical protein COUCH_26720 [Couchioplanes caeruleus]
MNTAGRRTPLIAVMVALPLMLASCGVGDGVEVPTTAPLRPSPAVGAITDPYFGNDDYIGRTVTVTATVSKVITERSFVLTGNEYGDDSILVLSAPGIEAEPGKQVTVTGVVRKFTYGAYFDDYDLGGADSYEDFDAEEFLVATGTPSPGPSPSV